MLPLCDKPLSKIREDKRLSYYSDVERWLNIYAYQIGLGGSYCHGFKPVKIPEIICHDGCIVRDGVRGGTSGTIYCHWRVGADYDYDITKWVNYWRWLQIKRVKNSATMAHQQRKYRTFTTQAKISLRMVMPYPQHQFSRKSHWTWSLWGWYKLVNRNWWWCGGWDNRKNLQQSWYQKEWTDSPGQWLPLHQYVWIQAQTQVVCEASWVEFMGQYWGKGNHVGDESDGGRRGGEWEKIFREHPHSTWDNYFST